MKRREVGGGAVCTSVHNISPPYYPSLLAISERTTPCIIPPGVSNTPHFDRKPPTRKQDMLQELVDPSPTADGVGADNVGGSMGGAEGGRG